MDSTLAMKSPRTDQQKWGKKSCITHMRHNQIPSHNNQIIHTDPCPIPLTPIPLGRHISPDLPRPLQKQPHRIALLHPANSARRILASEEDEWQAELRLFDSFLNLGVFFAELVFQGGFAEEGGFGLRFRLEGDGGVGFEAFLWDGVFGVGWSGG